MVLGAKHVLNPEHKKSLTPISFTLASAGHHKELSNGVKIDLKAALDKHQAQGDGLACLAKPELAAMKTLAMRCLIKVADLGHLYAPGHVHQRWAKRLEQEFFTQGDQEKAKGLGKSPYMDRDQPDSGVTKTQDGFFQFVATPLLGAWCSSFPGCSGIIAAAEANRVSWQ